jgi:amino acid transporter
MNEPNRNRKLGPAGWIALIVLAGLLAVSAWYAIHAWTALSGVAMSPLGWLFLILGALFTLALGAGLMALVFYSSRHDYDR